MKYVDNTIQILHNVSLDVDPPQLIQLIFSLPQSLVHNDIFGPILFNILWVALSN